MTLKKTHSISILSSTTANHAPITYIPDGCIHDEDSQSSRPTTIAFSDPTATKHHETAQQQRKCYAAESRR
jgi:hypothetical protein